MRVVDPISSAGQAAVLFAFYVLLLTGMAVVARYLLSSEGRRFLAPQLLLIGAGIALMAAAVAMLPYSREPWRYFPIWAIQWLLFVHIGLFATGWLAVGAGLGPGGQMLRGVLLATVAYVVVGLGWVIGFNVSLSAPITGLAHPGLLVLAVIWPFQIPQAVGLFGLEVR